MKGKFLLVLSIASALGILIVLSYRENGIKTDSSHQTSSMQGFHLTQKEGDEIRWELSAESAVFPEGINKVILKTLTMRIHHTPELTLTGGGGIYNIQKNFFTIDKPVKVIMDSSILTTDSLVWNGEEELITSPDNIKLTGKNFLIEGTGLAIRVRKQEVKILKDVKGTFYH